MNGIHFQRIGPKGSGSYVVLGKLSVLGTVTKQIGRGRYEHTTTTWWLADDGHGHTSTHRGRLDAARHLDRPR